MKFSHAFLAAVSADLSQEFYERRIVINSHLNRFSSEGLDLAHNKKDIKYYQKFVKYMEKISEATNDDGTRCFVEDQDVEVVEDQDDIQVFSEDDMCKLNSQLNSAMSSFARQWACSENGRGNVSRQVVRRMKKLKNQYANRKCLE